MNLIKRAFAAAFPPPYSIPTPHRKDRSKDSTTHPTHVLANARCAFTFFDGRQCRNQRAQLCAYHASNKQPGIGVARRQKGVPITPLLPHKKVNENEEPLGSLEALCGDLTTCTNINRALAQVFLLMAQGRIPQKQAVAFGYLSQLLLQTVPGIRAEYVSIHGYRSWEERLKCGLESTPNQPASIPEPDHSSNDPNPPSGQQAQPACSPHHEPEPSHSGPAESFGEQATPLDYADLLRRSRDLLDRKYDVTPEGRREANALVLELELMKPPAAKPPRDFQGRVVELVRRLRAHKAKAPASPAVAANVPANASGPPPTAVPSASPPQPGDPSPSPRHGRGYQQLTEPQPQPSVPRPARASSRECVSHDELPCSVPGPAPTRPASKSTSSNVTHGPHVPPHPDLNPDQNLHRTDWYAPASWLGRQRDPFPTHSEKFKRELLNASNSTFCRRRGLVQNRSFWR